MPGTTRPGPVRPEKARRGHASYDRVIALDPDYAKAYSSKGVALQELKRLDEALAACDRAIAINPDDSGVHYNRGKVLQGLKRWDEAAASYECAVVLEPGKFNAEAMAQHCRMLVCNWDDFDRLTYKLLGQIKMGELVAAPFPILALPASPGLLQHCAVAFAKARLPEQALPSARPARPPREKIRLGYFSADFYNHPVALLTAELFERHDRARFEVVGFSCCPSPDDAVTGGCARLLTGSSRYPASPMPTPPGLSANWASISPSTWAGIRKTVGWGSSPTARPQCSCTTWALPGRSASLTSTTWWRTMW